MNRQAKTMVLGLGVAVLILLLALPATSTAKSGYFTIKPSQAMQFRLKGSNGYSILVFANPQQVSLIARHGGSSATYSVPGLASPRRIKARFGRFGRVSMRFHSDGSPRRVPQPEGNCRGNGEIVDSGIWVGKIEFEGEQGYTTLHATRARGKVIKTLKQTCSGQEGEGTHSSDIRWTILQASSDSGPLVTSFQVTSKAHPALDGSAFVASVVEFYGRRLFVVRSIGVKAGLDAFASTVEGGGITSVTITPPAPFEGTATFQRTKGSKGSWSGSLVGDFPGRGDVVLAGPEFSAKISKLRVDS